MQSLKRPHGQIQGKSQLQPPTRPWASKGNGNHNRCPTKEVLGRGCKKEGRRGENVSGFDNDDMYVCINIYIYLCTYIYKQTCSYIHMYMYLYYLYTHICTYIFLICSSLPLPRSLAANTMIAQGRQFARLLIPPFAFTLRRRHCRRRCCCHHPLFNLESHQSRQSRQAPFRCM